MKKSVLIMIVTVSLAAMAAQAAYSPCSLTTVAARTADTFPAADEETASRNVLKMGLGLLARAVTAPIPIFTEMAQMPGMVLSEESSEKTGPVEGAKTDAVLNEDEEGEDEDGDNGEEDEEEEEGWDRVWDAPKLA